MARRRQARPQRRHTVCIVGDRARASRGGKRRQARHRHCRLRAIDAELTFPVRRVEKRIVAEIPALPLPYRHWQLSDPGYSELVAAFGEKIAQQRITKEVPHRLLARVAVSGAPLSGSATQIFPLV